MAYNPFDKPIESLNAKDLQSLIKNKVREGYHVEYKSDLPENKKIGKSVASFANAYGGWYIIGVETNEHNVAKKICGFDLVKCKDPISKIREIVKSHIDPVPVFYSNLIKLKNHKAVFIVDIPGNQETPFLTKDGRIYRRNSDSSDPIPENDRYAIDKLVERGQVIKEEFKRFCNDERTFSKAEEKTGWINICISPYPLGVVLKKVSSSKDAEALLQMSKTPIAIPLAKVGEITGNLPLNFAQTTFDSIILRQGNLSKIAFNGFTVELFFDGRAKFHIPVPYYGNIFDEIDLSESSKTHKVLKEIMSHENNLCLRFFDIGKLWFTVAFLISYYQKWLGEESSLVDYRIGILLDGIWRAVPFSESEEWALNIEKFGPPIKSQDNATIPKNINNGLLYDSKNRSGLWLGLCYDISLEFGLPQDLYSHVLINAFIKAIKESSQSIT